MDRESLVDLIVTIGALGAAREDILAIDCNPVIAAPDGALAVDALVVVRAHD